MTHKWTDAQCKWIDALRSGEYKQGQDRLNDGDAFCCLGVACHTLYGPRDDGRWFDMGTVAPDELVRDLHLRDENGGFPLGKELKNNPCLTDANDRDVSFTEIADFIEANPEAVFKQEGEA